MFHRKRRKVLLLSCLLVLSLSSFLAKSEVHQLSEPLAGSFSAQKYFNQLGLDQVSLKTECNKDKCIKNIVSRKKVLFSNVEANQKSVSVVASGRYNRAAYMLIKESGKKTFHYIIKNNGRKTRYKYKIPDALYQLVNNHGKLVSVTADGIYIDNKLVLPSAHKLIRAKIKNAPSGELSVTAITEANEVMVSNLKLWLSTQIFLAEHGDIDQVVASYANNDNIHYGAVYNYVNNYNKGLRIFKVNFKDNTINNTWLYNSDTTSIGFNPDIFLNKNTLTVSAKNSSLDRWIHFSFDKTLSEDNNGIDPLHISGFEEENTLAFTIGGGLALQFWEADSKVENNDIALVDVDYKISSAIYKSALVQGRFDNTQLGIAYLKNESEKSSGLVADASEYLSMYVDFNDFLEGSRSLRLSVENATINGVAKVKGADVTPATTTFSTEFNNYSVLVMAEQGKYSGVQLSQYTMPSAVGFSNLSGATQGYYDPDLGITRVSYVFGYDELAYSKRYETDFSRDYFSYSMGLGLGVFDISSSVTSQAETDLGSPISNALFFELNAAVEYGYIIQKRLKSLAGFGGVFQVGYKARLSAMGSGRGDNSETTDLVMEFSRQDLLHGPFVRGSLIF